MPQNLHLMLRQGYQLALRIVRKLPPEEAAVVRQAALQLVAYDVLAVFHRSAAVEAVDIKVDYSPEDPEDRYEVSARNGFFDIHGDGSTASEHGLKDSNMPLELMSTAVVTIHRADPLVQLSLSEPTGRDRLLHHRVVQQLATELDISFPFP